MFQTLQIKKHGNKKESKEHNKQQKLNVGMLFQSTNNLKVCTKKEYSQIILNALEYFPLCKFEDYFDYLKFISEFLADIK